MPIKFKCSCGHGLSVPEKFAGKNGKCPKCQKLLKVPLPSEEKTPTAARAPSKETTQKSAKKTPVGAQVKTAAPVVAPTLAAASGMDSLFDELGLKQKSGPVCTKCGTDIKRGAVVCTKCGLNFESGEMLIGFDAVRLKPEFDNPHLQEASNNMVRDTEMNARRDRSTMPWWVIMSFLIGVITLCAAGVVIVDGRFGTLAEEKTFTGELQRLPVFSVLGMTACITGIAITSFAHLSITFFGFTKNVWQGLACLFLPLVYSVIYGIMNWGENKAPVKAIITALLFIGFGVFLIIQGGGFGVYKIFFDMM